MDENKKNIKLIRFTNNYDLVAEVQEEPNNKIRIIKPMVLHIETDLDAQKQLRYMYQWIPSGVAKDETFLCSESNILFMCDIHDDVINYYKSAWAEVEEEEKLYQKEREESSKDKVVSFYSKLHDKNTIKH